MTDALAPLTITYLERRPASAAGVLADLDPVEAAALLGAAPSRVAATVLTHLALPSASSVLMRMTPIAGAAVVRALDYQLAAALLRLTPASERRGMMEALPATLRRTFEMTLSFPGDTVGAHMTTAVIALRTDETVGEARAAVQRSPQALAEAVFVVDDHRRLVGIATAAALLRHSPRAELADVMDERFEALSARARLASIAELAIWREHAALPVVGRRKQLIGALSRGDAAGVGRHRATGAVAGDGSLFISMFEAFFAVSVGLGEMLADAPPRTRRTRP